MRKSHLPLLLAFPPAFVLLGWRFFSSQLHYDSALVGLMGLSFLEGQIHPFFFGNNYMGTLDAILAAPLLALFGPNTLALTIWPPLLYLATMGILYLVMRRFFGPVGQAAGLLWMALPPAYFLFFAGEARTHYGLGLLLSAWLLWLTTRLWETQAPRPRALLGWGILAGLAFWTNFLSAQMIAPCGLLLFLGRRRVLGLKGLALALLGGAIGAAPLLAYNWREGWPHLGLGGDFRLGPATGAGGGLSWDHVTAYAQALWDRGLPIMLGVISPHEGPLPTEGLERALFWVLAAGALAGAFFLFRLAKTQRPALIPAVMVLLCLLSVLFTHYGSQVAQSRPRYLLWLLLALPFFWGALAQAAWRFRKWAGLVLAGVWLLVNCLGYADFRGLWGQELLAGGGGFYFQKEKALKSRLAELPGLGVDALYAHGRWGEPFEEEHRPGAYVLDFLSGSGFTVAELWQDKRPLAAARADAALSPGFWWAPLRPAAEFLGLSFQVHRDKVFHSFGPPPSVERLINLQDSKAHLLDGTPLGQVLWDFNRRSAFVADRLPGRDGFVLDLGRPRLISGLALFPTVWHETPKGLRLEGAGEDGRFFTIRETASYGLPLYVSGPRPFLKARYGRVEAYFEPLPLRYLRVSGLLEHRGHVWSAEELLLFGPGGEPLPGWNESMEKALELVAAHEVKRLFADAWPSAVANLRLGKKVWTLPANLYSDPYGGMLPHVSRPLALDVNPGSALLMRQRNAGQAAKVLAQHGVAFRRLRAGRFSLFLMQGRARMTPLPIASVSSPHDPEAAAQLHKGLSKGRRWSTGRDQETGMHLQLDLGEERSLAWVELANPVFHGDYPRALTAQASSDGKNWRPVKMELAGPLAFSGQYVTLAHGASNLFRLEPGLKTRHLRLALAENVPHRWWSVEKIRAFGP